MRRPLFLAGAAVALMLALFAHLTLGAGGIAFSDVVGAFLQFDPASYDQAVILYQRLPRALIAIYVGAALACNGVVLQGLVRNPLASPSTLGVNAGASLFLVAGVFLFDLDVAWQGLAALAGAFAGFFFCLFVARLAGRSRDPRGLALILSGSLVSMLLVGLTNALLLSDPARRGELLSWVTGNINHVYIDRLQAFWWVGALALGALAVLARPLTLILVGAEKAASAGVNVPAVSRLALVAAVLAAGSAVAICGPIGFVGLVVPHVVRPFVGNRFAYALPACALAGAAICLLADLLAREAFRPHILHTGLVTDLLGGVVFVAIVKRFYLSPAAGTRA